MVVRYAKYLVAALSAGLVGSAASSTVLTAPSSGVSFSAYSGPLGTLVDSSVTNGVAFTFAGQFRTAVYRTVGGTLDFFYQFANLGPGTDGSSNAIRRMSAYNFDNYLVDALYSDSDLDGGGIFTAANNPGVLATADRSDGVLGINFNINNKVATGETSATYVFRTNATNYAVGTTAVIDGSTLSTRAFQPASAVPEPATWLSMTLGFGVVGMALRGRRRIANTRSA